MPRYKLRTLLILLAVGPMVVAGGYWQAQQYLQHQEARRRLDAAWDDGMQEALRVFKELSDSGQLD